MFKQLVVMFEYDLKEDDLKRALLVKVALLILEGGHGSSRERNWRLGFGIWSTVHMATGFFLRVTVCINTSRWRAWPCHMDGRGFPRRFFFCSS